MLRGCELHSGQAASPMLLGFAWVVAACSSTSSIDSRETDQPPPFDVSELELVFYHENTRALAAAAGIGDVRRVEQLVSAGADVDAQGRHGVTPLMWAIARRCNDGVHALLAAGATVALADDDAQSAITLAAGIPDTAILAALLATGVNTDAAGPAGATPLIIAAAEGLPENVAALLGAGASTGASDDSGQTALHHALLRNSGDVAALLLDAGAEAFAKNRNGVTPFDLAVVSSSPAIRQLFALADR